MLEPLRFGDDVDFTQELSTQGSLMFSVEWVPAVPRGKLVAPPAATALLDQKERISGRGVLKLHLRRAVGLLPADASGRADPFVVATLGTRSRQSHVVRGTLEPTFNETLDFGNATLQQTLVFRTVHALHTLHTLHAYTR